MQDAHCRRDHLAGDDHVQVERCECGTVHLTIGALTLRLRPEALATVASVIGDAARTLAVLEAIRGRAPVPREALS